MAKCFLLAEIDQNNLKLSFNVRNRQQQNSIDFATFRTKSFRSSLRLLTNAFVIVFSIDFALSEIFKRRWKIKMQWKFQFISLLFHWYKNIYFLIVLAEEILECEKLIKRCWFCELYEWEKKKSCVKISACLSQSMSLEFIKWDMQLNWNIHKSSQAWW